MSSSFSYSEEEKNDLENQIDLKTSPENVNLIKHTPMHVKEASNYIDIKAKEISLFNLTKPAKSKEKLPGTPQMTSRIPSMRNTSLETTPV